MNQLQFLKIEQNPIEYPPPEVVDFSGQDMEGWLYRLKSFLVTHKKEHEVQPIHIQGEAAAAAVTKEGASILQQRGARSASLDSLSISPIHHQSKSENGLRLNLLTTSERPGQQPLNISPDPISHKLARTSSQHGGPGEDHYRFISHSRGVSGDSTSSFCSTNSNDCEKYSEIYFQRLATYPPLLHPLPSERMRLVEAARGILFALSQIYRAVKQVIGCSTDEKFSLMFTRLLQSANGAMAQLIQSLDRFDSSAQVQVPDQSICSEIMRCCESNVAAFRKLVHMVQAQIRNISVLADARLVRNLVLMLHGALAEIRVAWDSLLPLLQGYGEGTLEVFEPSLHSQKDQLQQQQHHQTGMTATSTGQGQHYLSTSIPTSLQTHPFQLSPTIPTSSTWLPVQIPQRSQNMSRASNHSAQSTNNQYHDDEEDAQLLVTVEHAIEAARRVIQCLTETCMTRVENLLASPQHRPTHRARSVSASPPRSVGSNGSNGSNGSTGNGNGNPNGKNASQDQQGRGVSMSPLQLATDTSASGASAAASSLLISNSGIHGSSSKSEGGLVRSPLFSPDSDTVPYSNGMCVALPIDQPSNSSTESAPLTASATSGNPSGQGEDNNARYERRLGSHSKGSSKTSFDPALPSIPQDEDHEISAQDPITAKPPTPQYQPIMTARSASVSGLPSSTHHGLSSSSTPFAAASSLPSQGFMGVTSIHPHLPVGHPQATLTGLYPSSMSFPFASGAIAPLPASQLWREMKDCLLQMTEIVKRLDLDLTMLRTDDYSFHPHHQHLSQQYQHGQLSQYSQIHHQNHVPHPHQQQPQQSQQLSQQQQFHHGSAPHQQYSGIQPGYGADDPNILKRRFGMGISDFVKSVVVISTLVRQLSTSSASTSRSGSGSAAAGDTSSKITANATAGVASSSSSTALSTSPSAPRARSESGADGSNLSTPTAAAVSSAITTDVSLNPTAATPSYVSISASSSASGAGIISSPEKSAQLQSHSGSSHQLNHRQPQSQSSKHSQPHQQQQPHQQSEIFSRLVMTNVSNLTKITKELTVRMPRSSFRDYLLSSSAGGGLGGGPGGAPGGGTAVPNGGNGSYGVTYGPAGSSILAMRKGSLI
ncbi:RAM signaling pathway protein-domain-containing protein [Gamsiella multidivaricata]|uniref:RAM signaling pathway protein-domain-containing protein n=1 Tax=Gamsiella multidivaricata TaxID=101098 RepID=UPI0022211CAC|nr:RAM signaling pathway protein-domain-containing protein [Gamsiella multidivaricata]KAI7817205.1 RAM signaling pathway protein-domain-containing protein [Gamsiella multidivaricata]